MPSPPSTALRTFIGLVVLSFIFVLVVLLRINSIGTPGIHYIPPSNPVVPSSNGTHPRTHHHMNNATTLTPVTFPFMDEGSTWKDHFCDEFLSNKFSVRMTPCDESSTRVLCYGSPYDDKMGSCFIKNVAMDPGKFYSIMRTNRDGVESTNSLWLVQDTPTGINPCPNPVFNQMEKYMVGGDYVKRLAKTAIKSSPNNKCTHWINGTTFMFMGFDDHIYFKYLSWFSLHNGIINYESNTGQLPSMIIRIPQGKDQFMHADYEQKLFPETKLMSLQDFSSSYNDVTCFENMVITPWAYSTSAFRCKMADAVFRLRNKCYNCNSRGLPGTRYSGFRRRAISACSIDEVYPDPVKSKEPKKIVVEIRRPYMRHKQDSLQSFHRILVNPNELLQELKKGFPNAEIHSMVGEELSLCEQIKLVHDSDILMGVHGAGLVHLWWLQDHALLFELVPRSQTSNPTFKMLSTLTGRRYHEYLNVQGSEMKVVVDGADIVRELKKHY